MPSFRNDEIATPPVGESQCWIFLVKHQGFWKGITDAWRGADKREPVEIECETDIVTGQKMVQNQPRIKVRVSASQILVATFILIFVSLSSFFHLLKLTSDEFNISTDIALAPRQGDNSSKSKQSNSYHFLISSDCTSYQRWEVLVQLHSAQQIQQCGRCSRKMYVYPTLPRYVTHQLFQCTTRVYTFQRI